MRDEEPSSSLVALDVAIQIEKGGRDFYRRAAAIAEDGGGRVLFAFLADAEAEHLQILNACRQSLGGDGRRSSSQEMEEARQPPVEGRALYSRLSLGQDAGAYAPDLLALHIGLLIEEAASAFYGRAAERSVRVDDKSLYEKLLNMETEHQGILEEEYNGLAREFSRRLGFAPFWVSGRDIATEDIMMQETDDALSVLREAVRNELDGKAMYLQAAQRTEHKLGKDMFRSFAAEEEQHIHILQAQYARVNESGEFIDVDEAQKQPRDPSLVLFPREEREVKELVPEGTSDLEALKIAMEFEQRAVRMYEEAADEADDPTAQAFFDELAEWEGTHYEILDNSYDYLSTEGEWYFQEEEMPFYIG